MGNAARYVRLFDLNHPYPAITSMDSQLLPTKPPNVRLPRQIPFPRPGWTDVLHNFRRVPVSERHKNVLMTPTCAVLQAPAKSPFIASTSGCAS